MTSKMPKTSSKTWKVVTAAALTALLSYSLNVSAADGVAEDVPASVQSDRQAALHPTSLHQLSDEPYTLEDEIAYIREEFMVTIASRREEKLSRAPSIVTVITARDIEDMNLLTLTDLMQIVPGFDTYKNGESGEMEVNVRGMTESSANLKVLIDGHTLNFPFNGEISYYFDNLSLKNVERVEIIRGQGSVMYGTNATLAVVNIITKDASDIDGIEASSGFGSYDTQKYSVLFGREFGDIAISGLADFFNTNGLNEKIKEDALSGLPIVGRFSGAPGNTHDSRNMLDMYMKASYKELEFRAMYTNKDNENFVGTNGVVTSEGEFFFNHAMAELSYRHEVGEWLTVSPRVWYDQFDSTFTVEPFPDGFVLPDDVDGDGDFERFPDGVLQTGIATVRRTGGETQFDIDIFDGHAITAGLVYEWERLDNVQVTANFDPRTFESIGETRSFTDTAPWIREPVRQVWSVYLQDKWAVTGNVDLTYGIRHDHYSDVEGTTNPRLGLVWNLTDNLVGKLLYGQGFRVPSFLESFAGNNPAITGNSGLEPEIVRTYEAAIGYTFLEDYSLGINYFYNVIRDAILTSSPSVPGMPSTNDNTGSINVQGIEIEARADFSDIWGGAYAFANYTYQDAESKGDPQSAVPRHKGNIGVNVRLHRYLNANLHAFISGKRLRDEEDPRDYSPGYGLLNLTLTSGKFFNGMTVKASLFNLLDKDYNDPSPINTVPTDFPRPGRNFFVEVGYDW